MPLSPHRLALAGILLLVAAFAALPATVLAAPPAGAAPAAPSKIVTRALEDIDTWQGECWIWMKTVVEDVTGKPMGFDYRQAYLEAGAVEVTVAQAQAGDVIQIAADADTSPSADYNGLHTAIVLENHGDGTFVVIDSNAGWDGMVRIRDAYSPSERASSRGIQFHIYRLPVGGGAPLPAPGATVVPLAPTRAYVPSDRAIVQPGTGGLNLRPTASTSQAPIGVLSDGTRVTIASAQVTAEGRAWVRVVSPLGEGWVAVEYLERAPALVAASSADGPVALTGETPTEASGE